MVFSLLSTELKCDMNFAVFVPPQAASEKVPILYWLSGTSNCFCCWWLYCFRELWSSGNLGPMVNSFCLWAVLHIRGIASFMQLICTCILQKLVWFILRFSVTRKTICRVVTWPSILPICSCLSHCYSASFLHKKYNSLSSGMW